MNLLLRLFIVTLKIAFMPKCWLTGLSDLHFRVWLNDADTNFHKHNGRYLIDYGFRKVSPHGKNGDFLPLSV